MCQLCWEDKELQWPRCLHFLFSNNLISCMHVCVRACVCMCINKYDVYIRQVRRRRTTICDGTSTGKSIGGMPHKYAVGWETTGSAEELWKNETPIRETQYLVLAGRWETGGRMESKKNLHCAPARSSSSSSRAHNRRKRATEDEGRGTHRSPAAENGTTISKRTRKQDMIAVLSQGTTETCTWWAGSHLNTTTAPLGATKWLKEITSIHFMHLFCKVV